MTKEIIELAESMGVSYEDVLCLAKSVANSITKDGATDYTLENKSVEMVEAYIPHVVNKFEAFRAIYQTKNGAKEAFCSSVQAII